MDPRCREGSPRGPKHPRCTCPILFAAPQVGLGWVYAITKNKTVEQLANK